MSDYGFATYDEKTGRLSEKINSKYPIFGPEYRKIATQYKTIHVNDITVKNVKPQTLPNPEPDLEWDFSQTVNEYSAGGVQYRRYFYNYQNYGFNSSNGGVEKREIYRYKHGFSKRPLGYYVITGDFKINNRAVLKQDILVNNTGVSVGGTTPLETVDTTGYSVIPRMNRLVLNDAGGSGVQDNFPIENIYTTKTAGLGTSYIRLPQACFNFFVSSEKSPSGVFSPCAYTTDVAKNPVDITDRYSVEIDDEWVVLYRTTYYNEYAARFAWATRQTIYENTGSGWRKTSDVTTTQADVTQRVRMVDDYAGSNLDITVYLVPYNMEDLG